MLKKCVNGHIFNDEEQLNVKMNETPTFKTFSVHCPECGTPWIDDVEDGEGPRSTFKIDYLEEEE